MRLWPKLFILVYRGRFDLLRIDEAHRVTYIQCRRWYGTRAAGMNLFGTRVRAGFSETRGATRSREPGSGTENAEKGLLATLHVSFG